MFMRREHLFFSNRSNEIIEDDFFACLKTFLNVLITAYQGFFTREALTKIADTTKKNIFEFTHSLNLTNEISIGY